MRGNSAMGDRVVHQSHGQKKSKERLHLGEIGREIEGKSGEIGDGLGEIGPF